MGQISAQSSSSPVCYPKRYIGWPKYFLKLGFNSRSLVLLYRVYILNPVLGRTKDSRAIQPYASFLDSSSSLSVKVVSALTASASLFTPHCTSLTLDKSDSLSSRLRSEGVSLLAHIMVQCWTVASWWPSCLHALHIYQLDNLACFRLVFRKFGAHFA